MTEGELKKRMRKLYNPHWESVKIIDADKLETVGEEMKADFWALWTLKQTLSYYDFVLRLKMVTEKWLGTKTKEPTK